MEYEKDYSDKEINKEMKQVENKHSRRRNDKDRKKYDNKDKKIEQVKREYK